MFKSAIAIEVSMFVTMLRKNGQRSYILRNSSMEQDESAVSKAVPKPYQAGRRKRLCVQANTHGIARSSSIELLFPLREAGREPSRSRLISRIGVAWRKNSTNCGSSYTNARHAWKAVCENSSITLAQAGSTGRL